MIVGIGVDIVEVARIAKALERQPDRFLRRMFTPAEIAYCCASEQHRNGRLAARFAAKEAALKSLGLGLRGVKWTDVAIARDKAGRPTLQISGRLAEIAREQGVTAFHVSLSHSKDYALAQVVAVR